MFYLLSTKNLQFNFYEKKMLNLIIETKYFKLI